MYATKLFTFLLAAATAEAQAFVSPIVSEPASVLAIESAQGAYVSALTTGAAFKSLSSELPEDVLFNLKGLGYVAAGMTEELASLPTAVQAFVTSVEKVEQSIIQTTAAASEVSALYSSIFAQETSIEAYLESLTSDGAVASLVSQLPTGVQGYLEVLNDFAPLIEEFGSALPDDVKSLATKIISYENAVEQFTAIGVVESGFVVDLPSTTFTGGTFLAEPTAGAPSSSSSAAAPTGLTCGISCRVMAGAMAGVALGAIAL